MSGMWDCKDGDSQVHLIPLLFITLLGWHSISTFYEVATQFISILTSHLVPSTDIWEKVDM